MFGLTSLDARADGTVDRFGFVFLGILFLFVLRIDKRIVAVLADKDFVGHGFVYLIIVDLGGIEVFGQFC